MKSTRYYFSVYDLIIIAIMSGIGIAIKPVVSTLARIVTVAIPIPGGSLAGGLYMMWLVLAFAITRKYGTATLVGVIQAIVVIITGIPGSHGIMSLFSYISPGLVVDIFLLILLLGFKREFDRLASFFSGVLANMTGTLAVNVIFFHLPTFFLILTLCVAALSGGIGGIIAWELYKILKKNKLVNR